MGILDVFRRKKTETSENEIEKGMVGGAEVFSQGVVGAYDGDVIPYSSYIRTEGNLEKVPMKVFSERWMFDLVYNSDLLRTVVKILTSEAFKNGIKIEEKYRAKCPVCGKEFAEDIDICPYDMSLTIKPNQYNYTRLEEFLSSTNRFDEDVLTTSIVIDNDVNILDNGWGLLVKDYEYDEEGHITTGRVKEFVRLAPEKMRLIVSKYGFGRAEDGRYVYFCPMHRSEYVLTDSDEKPPRCAKCGGEMLKAWYMAREIRGSKIIMYGKEEVYHFKRYSNTEGYGVSPILAIWMKAMTLMKMDRFILEAYSLQRSPKALLVIRGRLDSVRQAWMQLMQKARENPEMIYPLVVEGDESVAGKRVVEYQPFDLKPEEMQWIETRQEFRDTVGVVYGVQPIFSSGKVGAGLQNEGLQIAVTNRAIEDAQRMWNNFFEWLVKQLGINDYELRLVENEIETELAKQELVKHRLEIAQVLQQFGYDIIIEKDERGLLDFDFVKKEEGNFKMTQGEGEVVTEGEKEEGEGKGESEVK